MLAPQVSVACVGLRYPNKKGGNRQFEIAVCERGESVGLEHEPRNPADQNAIKVISSRGIQMGYIAADRTWMIHRAWQEGQEVRAVFQQAYDAGCWLRIGFDEEPVLPPAALEPTIPVNRRSSLPPGADPDSGFWPDEEYDDG